MMSASHNSTAPQAIILAAGKGKRMGGDRAKVLFEVADRPMINWVVDACHDAGVARCVIVVGYQGALVHEVLAGSPQCVFVEQTEQLGTGHATAMAQPLFAGEPCDVFVLAGDGPLIRASTLQTLLARHRDSRAAATLATAIIDDPQGYGRVMRGTDGGFDRIVEQKDATAEQLEVREVNPSYYCFTSDALFDSLSRIDNHNQQGEYYLTDVPGLLKTQGRVISVVDAVPPEDVLSINTPEQLAEVDRILRARIKGEVLS
jgi:bifunctional UDP-N-acetylglucosamine pyrophosphorylase/glucosamine-1-phosphate N-acetyltransferase